MMDLKEKLAELRIGQGLTQRELASKINVSRQTIYKWEGGVAAPSAENLVTLSRLYGIPAEELLGREPGPGEEEPTPAEAEEPAPAPPGRRVLRTAAVAGLSACLLLVTIAAVITICSAIFKEPEKPEEPEDGIIWMEDLEPDYIDPEEVVDCTEGRIVIP